MFAWNYVYTEKVNGVTIFNLNPSAFEKWMHQNKAEYTGDFVDGCLLDNFVVSTKRGYAAIYERYINNQTSGYRVEFQPGTAEDVFQHWCEFEEMARSEMEA